MVKSGIVTFKISWLVKAKPLWLILLILGVASAGRTQHANINDSIAVMADNRQPEETIKRLNLSAFHFVKAPGNRINFGITGSEYHCVVLKLTAEYPCAGQYLSIDNTSLDTVGIYRIYDDKRSKLIYEGGDLIPFKNTRNYVWHTAPLEISSVPSLYLIALKASQKNINIRYEILDKDDLQQKYQGYDRIVFFYIGIVFTITGIIVLAFFLFRKAVFAVYLGYIICTGVWILAHYGRIFPFIYPNIPVINEIVKPVSSLGAGLFLLIVLHLVFGQYLKSRRWLQQLFKGMEYVVFLLISLMFLLLIPGLHTELKLALIAGWHIAIIFSIGIIVFTPLYIINSGPTAKIFSAGMLVICIMTSVQLIGNLGYIRNFFINEHGMAMGSLFEISIMAFGIFNSLLEERKHRERQVLSLEQEQTETLKKLITVQDNERKRIAGDLHDNIGPLLAALKINFRRIIHSKEGDLQNGLVARTESIIDDSIAEIRNVAHNLMPKGLSSNGLINTLNEYFDSIQQLYSKSIVFHHQIESILNPDLQINVYRIICELVLNAARHSNAHMITVRIMTNEKRVMVTICDDGQGFQPRADNQKKMLGLQNAESRVSYLKGIFSLKTEPGKGTVIEMDIPLQFHEA